MTAPTSPYFVPGASLTADTIEQRRKHIGASEIAAVCGLDDYRAPIDVWLSKRGLAPEFEGNEFTEWGHRFEDAIAEKYSQLFEVPIRRPQTFVSREFDWMSASPDRLVELPGGDLRGLEVKNKDARQLIHFGDEGTDQVPDAIAMQCHWSMMVTGLRTWDVAVLFGGNSFKWYRLEQDEALAKMLFDHGRAFWFDNVLADVAPPIDASESWAKHLQEAYAQRTDVIRPATQEEDLLIASLRGIREELKKLELEEQLRINQLKAAIGEGAGIIGPSGKCTWKAPKDSQIVDYESIAVKALNSFPEDQRLEILAGYTTTRKNARRFLPTFPKV
jgi:putative phage-type endonuclease